MKRSTLRIDDVDEGSDLLTVLGSKTSCGDLFRDEKRTVYNVYIGFRRLRFQIKIPRFYLDIPHGPVSDRRFYRFRARDRIGQNGIDLNANNNAISPTISRIKQCTPVGRSRDALDRIVWVRSHVVVRFFQIDWPHGTEARIKLSFVLPSIYLCVFTTRGHLVFTVSPEARNARARQILVSAVRFTYLCGVRRLSPSSRKYVTS